MPCFLLLRLKNGRFKWLVMTFYHAINLLENNFEGIFSAVENNLFVVRSQKQTPP